MSRSAVAARKHVALLFGLLTALSACGGGGSAGNSSNTATITLPTIAGGSTPAALFASYYVTAYDMVKVLAERASAPFVNSTITYALSGTGNPVIDGSPSITSNALLDAHLDYALSTGLTGHGVTLGMIDDQVDATRTQFSGKPITQEGASGTAQFHGTAVASVMLGNGTDGQMIGFAPGASLFAGTIDYSASLDWAKVGQYMLDAKTNGAIAVNNSWGLLTGSSADETVANADLQAEFASGSAATYLADVRSYIQSGVVVFAAQNDYSATSISSMAGLPSAFPDLKNSWIAVINAIPTLSGDTIIGAQRVSAPCAEAATYCMAANGQTVIVDTGATSGYGIGSGASFAAPQVTGALGLLAEAFPTLTPQQLRDRLLATANNSFYSWIGTVTFAPGIVHGYNAEFGMGFLDLKAALLPIGITSIPKSSGSSLPATQAVIVSSKASGNAVAASLSSAHILVQDQLGGNFVAPAVSFTAAPVHSDPASLQLSVIGSSNAMLEAASYAQAVQSGSAEAMLDHTDLMDTPDAASIYSGTPSQAVRWQGLQLSITRNNGRLTGASLSRDVPLGSGALRVGVSGFTEEGGVLGITAPGFADGMSSYATALKVSYALPLGAGTSLRAEGEFGAAHGTPGGLITSFGTLDYNRVGMAIDHAGALHSGDVLTFFARTPVAITRGSATLTLPVSYTLNGPTFSDTPVKLSPSSREIDVGMEYARPLGGQSVLRAGLALAENAGNVSGRSALLGVLGMAWQF